MAACVLGYAMVGGLVTGLLDRADYDEDNWKFGVVWPFTVALLVPVLLATKVHKLVTQEKPSLPRATARLEE